MKRGWRERRTLEYDLVCETCGAARMLRLRRIDSLPIMRPIYLHACEGCCSGLCDVTAEDEAGGLHRMLV